MRNSIFFLMLLFLSNCAKHSKDIKLPEYEDQIGDTPFDPNIDLATFKFCDSTNVLHKRALVRYSGGERVLEEALIENYIYKAEYKSFSGYFIVRFVVNCNNESGRFRTQILNPSFTETTAPNDLEKHVVSIVRNLKDWNHAIYKGQHYDCYKFLIVKIQNGKIQNV